MENNTYKHQLIQLYQASSLPASPLIRQDQHLFTFSPIQDEVDRFNQNSEGIYYKEQVCFRNVYPANLINPLSTPFQRLVSLFSFREVHFQKLISLFLNQFLGKYLNPDDIYIVAPDIPSVIQELRKVSHQLIIHDADRLQCTVPLPGEHFYIKLCLSYRNGLVTLMNFVLIDYQQGDKSKIDSVFFPLRLDMVRENAKSIYETHTHSSLYHSIQDLTGNHEMTHFLYSQMQTIQVLYEALGKDANHKHGYTLKKLIREVFLECDLHHLSLSSLLEFYPDLREKLLLLYQQYSKNIERALRTIKKTHPILDATYAHDTLGLPYKVYQSQIDSSLVLPQLPSNFAYYRDAHKNHYQKPIESYK